MYRKFKGKENYHDVLIAGLNCTEFPNLTYTRDLVHWGEFIRRTPEEYETWINGCIKECTILIIKILEEVSSQGKKVFVDTNIPIEVLWNISDIDHVLIMLADPVISVNRFFEFGISYNSKNGSKIGNGVLRFSRTSL